MGNDGGSIPDRRDLVRSKPKAEQADKANQARAKWFFCALSKRPLQEPIVSCALGKLYNKDALLQFLLDRLAFGDGEEICGHIRSLKDVKTLRLTPNPSKVSDAASSSNSGPGRAAYICPLNFKEMNGAQPFVYLQPCGCVFSQGGFKAVAGTPPAKSPDAPIEDNDPSSLDPPSDADLELCPQCASKYSRASDIISLNPSPELEAKMRVAMDARRAAEPAKVKGKGKKRKAGAEVVDAEPPQKKPALPSTHPNVAATSRAVADSLAKEEAKWKAGMSDAVKSLYGPKDGVKRKETFMTMGTFTRYA